MFRRQTRLLTLLLVLALFVGVGVAFAAASAQAMGYQVDFLGAVDNPDGTSTWTYAFTAIQPAPPPYTNALSHWTLGFDSGICAPFLVEPRPPGPYTTPTDLAVCQGTYACQAATYQQVELGLDQFGNVNGLKYGDADVPLETGSGQTHIFQFTLFGVDAASQIDMPAVIKAGNSYETFTILGPACPDPTAITGRSVRIHAAQPAPGSEALLSTTALFLLLLLVTAVGARRRHLLRLPL